MTSFTDEPLSTSDQSLSNAGREEDVGEDDGADDDAGVNFTHILRAIFFHKKNVLRNFYGLNIWLCNLLAK